MRRNLGVALAAVLVLGVAGACSGDRGASSRGQDETTTAAASPNPGAIADPDGPDAGDIAANPARYAGQRVTLKADVKKLLPNGFFVLDDEDTLVLSPMAQPAEQQEVTVRGTVQTYSAPEFEKKYSWFRTDEKRDAEYKDRAVVVAESIKTADGYEMLGLAGTLPAGAGEIEPPQR